MKPQGQPPSASSSQPMPKRHAPHAGGGETGGVGRRSQQAAASISRLAWVQPAAQLPSEERSHWQFHPHACPAHRAPETSVALAVVGGAVGGALDGRGVGALVGR